MSADVRFRHFFHRLFFPATLSFSLIALPLSPPPADRRSPLRMRWTFVAAAVAAVAVAAAVATSSHGSLVFEPAVASRSVQRPAFAAPMGVLGGELPQPLFTAVQFVKAWVPDTEFVVKDYYVTKKSGVAHIYLRQVVNGIEVYNADANVNVDRSGAITSAHHSFFTGETIQTVPTARIAPTDAARVLATYVGARAGDIKLVHMNGVETRGRGRRKRENG